MKTGYPLYRSGGGNPGSREREGCKIDSKELLVFFHITKTGGTTLRREILRNHYKNKLLLLYEIPSPQAALKELKKRPVQCISSHFGNFRSRSVLLGKLNQFRSLIFITMLRNPIEREISLYNYLREIRKKQCPADEFLKLDFEAYLNSRYHIDNYQTRYITGGSAEVNLAKRKLTRQFRVAGITELFKESVYLMKKELGWGNLSYTKQNQTKNRPERAQLPPSVLDLLADKNRLDSDLYTYARNQLLNRIEALNPAAKTELNKYIGYNKY